jgi:hypothetical protein
MASAKLTTSVRDTLVSRILKYRFSGEVAQLIADRADFANACYEAVYDEPTRKKMASLPKGWLPTDDDLFLRFGAETERVCFNGDGLYGDLSATLEKHPEQVRRPILTKHQNGVVQVFDAGSPIETAFAQLQDRKAALHDRVKDAAAQIRSVVNSVTTTGKLREVWPESAAFLEDFEDVKLNLPMVQVRELNALLDLPVEAEGPANV